MLNYVHIYICIVSSIIYIITALATDQRERLLIVLIPIMIISYILGLIVRFYLRKRVFDNESENNEETNVVSEEEQEETSDSSEETLK